MNTNMEIIKIVLLNNVTPYGLQLKRKAQIVTVSEDFSVKWTNILYDVERKLVQLLLKVSQLMYDKMDKELNVTIKSAYLENSLNIKNELINWNLALKITLNDRRVKKSRKFKQKNVTNDQAENKKDLEKQHRHTISIVERTESGDVRVYFDGKSDTEERIVNIDNDWTIDFIRKY